jgi:hypothetical protein
MVYKNGEEELVVADGEVMNVEGGTLHFKPICEVEASVYVTKS